MTMKNLTLTALVGLAAIGAAETDAAAERRTNSLSKDVAVRHRRLLVKNRFEVTPLFESTISSDFKHTIGGGLKLEYHLSDMLSFGVVGVASTGINTKLVDRVISTLPDADTGLTNPEPTKDQFQQRLNTMPLHGAGYISVTPWYGKLAAFSQAYVAFDFYFQAGISFATLQSDCPSCTDATQGDPDGMGYTPQPKDDAPLNSGGRAGLYLGGGIHVFLNDFLALDLTVRDYAFSDNPSGADYNADGHVGDGPLGDDNRFIHHLFFGVGLSIMFPTTVKRTP